MRVVHQQLYGTQWAVILTDNKSTWSPGPVVCSNRIRVLIRAVYKALVLPSIAPRVGHNPCSYLILFYLAYLTIAIQVELYTVVIATDGKGMVKGFTPRLYILHTHDPSSLIGSRSGNSSPCSVGSHTYTGHTTSVHGVIATMVIEPFLELLSSLRGIGRGHGEVVSRLVPHGAVPLIVALHPTVIGIVMRLRSKESAIGTSSVSRHIGDSYSLGHALCATCLISQQPGEMRGILVLGQRGIRIAITVHLVRKLIPYPCCRATGTAILIEDGREVLILSVIDKRRQLGLTSSGLTPCHIVSRLRPWGNIVLEVGKDTAVNLYHSAIRHGIFLYLGHSAKSGKEEG